MNYIYDIYLNLNKTLYDFYDWNKSDNLTHIKKIPIFMIDTSTFKIITYNTIQIDNRFINKINNLTETWNHNNISNCALFCDCNNIIAIEFNKDGVSTKKSFLYIDEESEILDDIDNYNITNISFKVINKTGCSLLTRKQNKINDFINNELKSIDSKRLDYIYYECTGKSNGKNIDKINNLKKINHNSKNYKNLYDILKLTSKESN